MEAQKIIDECEQRFFQSVREQEAFERESTVDRYQDWLGDRFNFYDGL